MNFPLQLIIDPGTHLPFHLKLLNKVSQAFESGTREGSH